VEVFERATTDQASVQQLRMAVELYSGDLLPNCYDEWLLQRREQLRQRFGEALERLIRLLEAANKYGTALGYAQRLRQHDPLHEESYRHLMRLYTLCGNLTGVRRDYKTCTELLRREFGTEPAPLTRALYEQLLGQAAPVPQRRPLPWRRPPLWSGPRSSYRRPCQDRGTAAGSYPERGQLRRHRR
jgi:DNA-binding SARP family transcriptional activator